MLMRTVIFAMAAGSLGGCIVRPIIYPPVPRVQNSHDIRPNPINKQEGKPTISPEKVRECAQYLGTVVKPRGFDEATKKYASIKAKGDYESTAEFEARVSKWLSGEPTTLIIRKNVINTRKDDPHLKYDADSHKLTLDYYAFGAMYRGSIETLDKNSVKVKISDPRLSRGIVESYDAIIFSRSRKIGTYEAVNAFGAGVTVQKEIEIEKIIMHLGKFDASLSPFLQKDFSKNLVELNLSPQEAQKLVPKLQIAFVVQPVSPFFLTGTRSSEPTMELPYESMTKVSVLFADFECGLLLDGANKVLGSYPML